MAAQANAPDDSSDLPVAPEPPENQVRGMATDDDLAGAEQEEETS